MKWWGWGVEGVEFTHEDKPALGPFIEEKIRRGRGAPDHPAVNASGCWPYRRPSSKRALLGGVLDLGALALQADQ